MAPPKDLTTLISLTQTTQTLLTHFQSSLTPTKTPQNTTPTSTPTTTDDAIPNPLAIIHASTTLLKSHTTTLSLLLLTPPLTPSALIAKIGDVTSGSLTSMVAAATYAPSAGARDSLGNVMRVELRAQVRRIVGAWGDVLALVLIMAEARKGIAAGKDKGPSESEKEKVLASTGLVWEVCDQVLALCAGGVVDLVLKKAQELRAVLLDAVEELKEWGEDTAASDDEEDRAEDSGDDEFADDDDFFGARNKLGKGDTELKALLDRSVKKVKMVSMLYQALGKRRLKTFPVVAPASGLGEGEKAVTNGTADTKSGTPAERLDKLMQILKSIPDTVDDLASMFYELDQEEAENELKKCCDEAKSAAELVKKSWTGADDEFTTWSEKWAEALDAV